METSPFPLDGPCISGVFTLCLGVQLLAKSSEESFGFLGLGKLDVDCCKFDNEKVRVPHVGWDTVNVIRRTSFLDGLNDEFSCYFAHSFYLPTIDPFTLATCNYETKFAAVVHKENLFGIQFHPERSQKVGLKLLENFYNLVRDAL